MLANALSGSPSASPLLLWSVNIAQLCNQQSIALKHLHMQPTQRNINAATLHLQLINNGASKIDIAQIHLDGDWLSLIGWRERRLQLIG